MKKIILSVLSILFTLSLHSQGKFLVVECAQDTLIKNADCVNCDLNKDLYVKQGLILSDGRILYGIISASEVYAKKIKLTAQNDEAIIDLSLTIFDGQKLNTLQDVGDYLKSCCAISALDLDPPCYDCATDNELTQSVSVVYNILTDEYDITIDNGQYLINTSFAVDLFDNVDTTGLVQLIEDIAINTCEEVAACFDLQYEGVGEYSISIGSQSWTFYDTSTINLIVTPIIENNDTIAYDLVVINTTTGNIVDRDTIPVLVPEGDFSINYVQDTTYYVHESSDGSLQIVWEECHLDSVIVLTDTIINEVCTNSLGQIRTTYTDILSNYSIAFFDTIYLQGLDTVHVSCDTFFLGTNIFVDCDTVLTPAMKTTHIDTVCVNDIAYLRIIDSLSITEVNRDSFSLKFCCVSTAIAQDDTLTIKPDCFSGIDITVDNGFGVDIPCSCGSTEYHLLSQPADAFITMNSNGTASVQPYDTIQVEQTFQYTISCCCEVLDTATVILYPYQEPIPFSCDPDCPTFEARYNSFKNIEIFIQQVSGVFIVTLQSINMAGNDMSGNDLEIDWGDGGAIQIVPGVLQNGLNTAIIQHNYNAGVYLIRVISTTDSGLSLYNEISIAMYDDPTLTTPYVVQGNAKFQHDLTVNETLCRYSQSTPTFASAARIQTSTFVAVTPNTTVDGVAGWMPNIPDLTVGQVYEVCIYESHDLAEQIPDGAGGFTYPNQINVQNSSCYQMRYECR